MTSSGAVPWPVPPSESTTRMFAALSPERLESESLSPVSLSSSERPASSELLTASLGAGEGGLPQDGDDHAKPPRRMRRLALVSGLSVILAVGVTAGGARLLAGRTSLALDQPTTACPTSENCAADAGPYGAGSGQSLDATPTSGDPTGDPAGNGQDRPGKEHSGTSGSGQEDSGAGTGEDTSAAPRATPVATAASKGRDRDHTSARTRASSTAAPRASAHPSGQVDDAPAAVTADPDDTTGTGSGDGATPGETPLDDPRGEDTGNGEDTGDADASDAGANRTTGAHPVRTRSALVAGAPAVQVRFTVTDRDASGYTARLAVRNEGPDLPAWTIRLAVGGQVTAVEGAGWRQQGDTLTLTSQTATSQTSLHEGGTLTLTIHAEGAPAAPADCVLSEGRCEITGPSQRG
ncbi:hypothetical protein [Microbispora hainanensis]|uniref:CBM2 domain-containing protein n=1 Tax=Microbispora hainanensis TaxID=568844 RepID=A0A544Z0H8_9ACTN|nr:hypothetical protein [Microbispora hainanensis]TQS22563.1 hypothetical protein FLX08_06880 [Microbispora hainanensis]